MLLNNSYDMIFDIKRYKYKFKNEIQIFIYQVFKVMSLQKRLNNYIVIHVYSVMDSPNLQIIIKIGMKNSVKNTQKWIAY